MKEFDPQALQEKYERWHALHQKTEEAQAQWLEAGELMAELQEYYQSEQWRIDNVIEVRLECASDVHSILSEDALWNSLANRQEQAIKWMRLGLDVIDRS